MQHISSLPDVAEYKRQRKDEWSPVLSNERSEWLAVVVNGYLSFPFQGGAGRTDQLILSGDEFCYEPFWYRTFRFIQITVQTGEEALTIGTSVYRRTGYPLSVDSHISSSVAWVNRVWEMCVRTLENCMMETYMDCPYYEQMQFPMDTRLQALFNYAVSRDVRLAKKALEDLHSSITPEGLVQGKYPSSYLQIISTLSLRYIFWQLRKNAPVIE